jgi:acetyltransferase-like isoleucine patch superfamily enzyme
MMNLLRSIDRVILYSYHYLIGQFRYHSFQWRSFLGPCDMLTNPKAISIGKRVEIRKGARLEAVGPWDGDKPKIVIGDNTSIHLYFHCGAAESVTIGKNVLIAGRVYISDHDHRYDDPEMPACLCEELKTAPVVIEDGVWLGEGSVILKGVTVGERAVVGANAVVTKDVEPYTIVAGVPAREIDKTNTKKT